ncbi:phage terminase large subunit [Azorhizobium caulinodans]|uniref:phage terminase large subunit n=1 Tax=Azorhizobium caulinodans TaxID=7 RepID=UPI002FBE5EF7
MSSTQAKSRSSLARTTPPFSLTDKQVEANRFLAGSQRHKGLIGGARSGKTFLLMRAVGVRALRADETRHAVLRFRGNAVRSSIALDTLPKVFRLCFPGVVLKEHRQDGFFELPNGSQIWLGGLDDKDRVEKILGQEFLTMYFNECSQIPYSSVLVARTRLAQVHPQVAQRAYYDLNPSGTGHWTYHEFIEGRDPQSRAPLANKQDFGHFFLNPKDNAANLSKEFLASLEALPEKQRKRFLEGRYVAEVDGALWTIDGLERCRWDEEPFKPGDYRLGRIVIGVDPSGAFAPEDKRSDEIGICAVGKLRDGRAVVLEDATLRAGPSTWARMVSNLFEKWGADCVVAEINFGGAMVESTLQTENKSMPVKVVTASRGKHVRAEPISTLYDKGLVVHAGRFPELEDQMTNFSTAGYVGERSPDRADAMIWAMSELMLGDTFDPNKWSKAFGD